MSNLENQLGKVLFDQIDETFRYIKCNKMDLRTFDKKFRAFNAQMVLSHVSKETMNSVNQVYEEVRRKYIWGDFK